MAGTGFDQGDEGGPVRRRPLPGGGVSPARALAEAARQLVPPFEVAPGDDDRLIELRDPASELPAISLRLRREKRLFSRTMFLVVEAGVEGPGPAHVGAAGLRKPRFGTRARLLWDPQGAREGDAWCRRFVEAGLVNGAMRMTNVQSLSVTWSPPGRRWLLRLETLAGALVGTGPGASVAIPIEPDDREGLLGVLRAVRSATNG